MVTAKTRSSIIKKNIIGGFLVKGVSILSSFLLIPITINYINSELYGIWLTISSIIQWLSFFDIGFGNGLKNKLANALSLQKYKLGKIYVSTAYAVVGCIFLSFTIILYQYIPAINWASFLNVSGDLNETLIATIKIVLLSFSFQFILKLIQNVIQAYQLIFISNALDAISNIISLCFIYILTQITFPSLTYIALAFCLSPIIVLVISSLILYSKKFRQVSPSFKYIRLSFAKKIFNLGAKFFVIQIAVLVIYQTVNIIIARTCGPDSVTIYNLAYKYFNVSLMVFNIAISPIWVAFTDAYTQQDYKWMRNIYTKLVKLFKITVLLILMMLLISPVLYYVWLGNSVKIPYSVSIFISIYMIILTWNTLHSMIINGIGKIRLQLYISIVMLILSLPSSIISGLYYGINGIIINLIAFNLLPAFFLYVQVKKILLREDVGIWSKE